MQRLGQVGLADALALAGADALRPAEHVQEVRLERLVGQHDRPLAARACRAAGRRTASGCRSPGRPRRAAPRRSCRSRIVAGIALLVVLVELVGHGAELIGPALDRSSGSGCLRLYLLSTRSLARASSSSGLRRRIGDAHVVERIDDAPAEEVGPVAVGDGPGEERVLRHRPSSRPASGADPRRGATFIGSPSSGFMTAGLAGALVDDAAGRPW